MKAVKFRIPKPRIVIVFTWTSGAVQADKIFQWGSWKIWLSQSILPRKPEDLNLPEWQKEI